jgi:WD40 repeat protein
VVEPSPLPPDTPPVEPVLVPLSSPTPTNPILPEPTATPTPQVLPPPTPAPEQFAEPEASPTPEPEEKPSVEPRGASLLSRLDFGSWDHVLAAAWSPGGELLAASAGEKVYLIAYPSMDVLYELPVGASTESLAFSPVGYPAAGGSPLLALAVKDGSVQIWNPASGELSCSFHGHRNGAKSLAFFPDGSRFATTGMDPMVRIWDLTVFLEEGVCPLQIQAEMIGSARAVPGVAVHQGGTFLASIDLRQIRLRETSTQRIMGTISVGETVYALSFSPDGRWLAGALAGDGMRIWDVNTLAAVIDLKPDDTSQPNRGFTWSIAFHPSGKWLAAGSSSGSIRIWQLDESEETSQIQMFDAHEKAVASLAFHPSEALLVSGGLDGMIKLWAVLP